MVSSEESGDEEDATPKVLHRRQMFWLSSMAAGMLKELYDWGRPPQRNRWPRILGNKRTQVSIGLAIVLYTETAKCESLRFAVNHEVFAIAMQSLGGALTTWDTPSMTDLTTTKRIQSKTNDKMILFRPMATKRKVIELRLMSVASYLHIMLMKI